MVTVTAKPVLLLIVFAQVLGAGFSQAQLAKVMGVWSVEINFENGNNRLLRFEARDSGKGSFLLLDPSLKVWGPAKPSDASWTRDDEGSVTFSGTVEFPLGNVGRDAGTLVLKGKFETEGSITGTVTFFSLGQDSKDPEAKPKKNGSFKASRVAGG